MSYSMESYINFAARWLRPELVAPGVLARINSIACLIPPGSAVLECRPGAPQPEADFLPRFLLIDGSYAALRSPEFAASLPAHLRDLTIWPRLSAFCRHWADRALPLHRDVMSIWLEFDLAAHDGVIPTPCFFFDFADHVYESLPITRFVLGQLLDPLPEASLATIARCYDTLPPDGRVFSVGVMFGRASDAVRLCVQIPAGQIRGYLERIGWPGAWGSIAPTLSRLGSMTDHVALSLDVGALVGPQLGIEYHIEGNHAYAMPRWQAVLDWLVAEHFCRSEKRDGILAWLGVAQQRSYQDVWPANLRQMSQAPGCQALSVFLRRLSHIKMVYQPQAEPELKAYLELLHRWFRFDPREQNFVFEELPMPVGD